MKKKILHILNTSSYSGAENVAITIINNMNSDYECAYASMDGLIRSVLDKNGITFLPISKMSIRELSRIITIYKPDIIHAHDFTASVVSSLSTSKIPIISHIHNNSPWIKTYHPYSFAYLLTAMKCKKILGVSESVFSEYVFGNIIKNKSTVVSNPIDLSVIKNNAKSAAESDLSYDIVFLGRLSTQKNPQRFIKIISELVRELPDVKVAIIGAGELKTECTKLIGDYRLENNIEMLGFMVNPYGILAASKILCMTSEWEGFGLVAVEALSLGVPVVANDVGGLPGIINNKCGALCKHDDEFILEIKLLLNDENYLDTKSKEAFTQAEKLENIDIYTSRIHEMYSEIL